MAASGTEAGGGVEADSGSEAASCVGENPVLIVVSSGECDGESMFIDAQCHWEYRLDVVEAQSVRVYDNEVRGDR